MAARRKAAESNACGIDPVRACAAAHQPHRALRVGARDVGAIFPAGAWKTTEEHVGGDASRREPARTLIALLVDPDIAIAAPGGADHPRAVGLCRTEDVEPGPDDMLDHPVACLCRLAALHDAVGKSRGPSEMAAGPEGDTGIGREASG